MIPQLRMGPAKRLLPDLVRSQKVVVTLHVKCRGDIRVVEVMIL